MKRMTKLEPIPIHWACPHGDTFEEMRAHLRETGLYEKGDTVLIWVNEGDFLHALMVCGSQKYPVTQGYSK